MPPEVPWQTHVGLTGLRDRCRTMAELRLRPAGLLFPLEAGGTTSQHLR